MFQVPSGEAKLLEYFTAWRIISVMLTLLVTWLLVRYASRFLNALSAYGARGRFLVKWFEPILRITLWFVATFLCFRMLAPNDATFLAAMGSLAIAVGLGTQDLVKNLVGGLVVLADRPYQVGDLVQIGDAYGEIDQIGLRSTKLNTFGDTRVTIPNATVVNSQVFNSNSGVPDCQVETFLYLPADADPEQALRIGYEAAYTCPFLHLAKPVTVLVEDNFSRRPYLRVHVKSYIFDHRYVPRMQSDITRRAKLEFLRRGMLAGWVAPEK